MHRLNRPLFVLLIFVLLVVLPAGGSIAQPPEDEIVAHFFHCWLLTSGDRWVTGDEEITYVRGYRDVARNYMDDGLTQWQSGIRNVNNYHAAGYYTMWGTAVSTFDDMNGGFTWQWVFRGEGGVPVFGHSIGHGYGEFDGQVRWSEFQRFEEEPSPEECGGQDRAGIWHIVTTLADQMGADSPAELAVLLQAFNDGMMDDLDTILHPEVVWVANGLPISANVAQFKASVTYLRELFPDWQTTANEVFSRDDMFIMHGAATGTHTGTSNAYPDLAPTGDIVTSDVAAYVFLEDGQITAVHTIFSDALWEMLFN